MLLTLPVDKVCSNKCTIPWNRSLINRWTSPIYIWISHNAFPLSSHNNPWSKVLLCIIKFKPECRTHRDSRNWLIMLTAEEISGVIILRWSYIYHLVSWTNQFPFTVKIHEGPGFQLIMLVSSNISKTYFFVKPRAILWISYLKSSKVVNSPQVYGFKMNEKMFLQ